MIRNSSSRVTLRSFVQPVDVHGTTDVSGISRDVSGPASPAPGAVIAPARDRVACCAEAAEPAQDEPVREQGSKNRYPAPHGRTSLARSLTAPGARALPRASRPRSGAFGPPAGAPSR